MAKRESKKVITGVTAEQYQEALAGYALNDAQHDKVLAKMNMEVTKVREKYDAELTALVDEKDKQYAVVQAYCVENKAVLFANRRSLDTAHGLIGFRLGTPALKTLPKWNWEKVLAQVKAIMPEYVRTHEEVDKESLLQNRKEEGVAEHLNEIGVYVAQGESFFIDLKKEEAAA